MAWKMETKHVTFMLHHTHLILFISNPPLYSLAAFPQEISSFHWVSLLYHSWKTTDQKLSSLLIQLLLGQGEPLILNCGWGLLCDFLVSGWVWGGGIALMQVLQKYVSRRSRQDWHMTLVSSCKDTSAMVTWPSCRVTEFMIYWYQRVCNLRITSVHLMSGWLQLIS